MSSRERDFVFVEGRVKDQKEIARENFSITIFPDRKSRVGIWARDLHFSFFLKDQALGIRREAETPLPM